MNGRRRLANLPNIGFVVPLAGVVVALLIMTAAQTFQLVRDHGILGNAIEGQQSSFVTSQRIRQQLDVIAGQTARLAAAGNENARRIVLELRQRGITVNPPPPPPAAPTAPR